MLPSFSDLIFSEKCPDLPDRGILLFFMHIIDEETSNERDKNRAYYRDGTNGDSDKNIIKIPSEKYGSTIYPIIVPIIPKTSCESNRN